MKLLNLAKRIFYILIWFVIVFNPLCLNAQIVNIENQRLQNKKEGWIVESDLNFLLMKNLSMIMQFGNRNKLNYKKEQHSLLLMTDANLIKINTSNYINSGFAHVRYSYNLHKFQKIYYESFLQSQYNRVQFLKSRNLLGIGARFEIVKLDSFAINAGTFVMGEYEVQTDEKINQTARYSCFLSFDYQFNKSTGINSITYYQPDFLFPADFRISSETSLRLQMTKKISFKVIYNLYFDTFPPQGIPTTFYYLSNSVSLRF